MGTKATRDYYLAQFGKMVCQAAAKGAFGKPIKITSMQSVSGPRAGAILAHAGIDSARLVKDMNKQDCALLRQFVPWEFPGSPQAFMSGRFVRMEAGWSPDLAETMIPLDKIGANPHGKGRWIVGINECGDAVMMTLGDFTPHVLIAGTTGAGKSISMRGALLQLSRDPLNNFVLVDGKQGEGLKKLEPIALGPVAVDGESIRNALGWANAEMDRRYQKILGGAALPDRLILAFDEFQEVMESDRVSVGLFRRLIGQGRAAGIHVIAATHHPTVESFGDPQTRRGMIGRIALRVADRDASLIAIGEPNPQANLLFGKGDGYAVAPGLCYRVQVAYTDVKDLEGREKLFEEWPAFEAENIGQEPGRPQEPFDGREVGIAIHSRLQGFGRDKLRSRLLEHGCESSGTGRLVRLMRLADDSIEWLDRLGPPDRNIQGGDMEIDAEYELRGGAGSFGQTGR